MSFKEWLSFIWYGYQSVMGTFVIIFLVLMTLGILVGIACWLDEREEISRNQLMASIEECIRARKEYENHLETIRLQNVYSEWNW